MTVILILPHCHLEFTMRPLRARTPCSAIRHIMLLCVCCITVACVPKPTLHQNWIQYQIDSVAVLGILAGDVIAAGDTVRFKDWWSRSLNEEWAASLQRNQPGVRFIGPSEFRNRMPAVQFDSLVSNILHVMKSGRGTQSGYPSIDFSQMARVYVRSPLQMAGVDALLVGVAEAGGWVLQHGGAIFRRQSTHVELRVAVYLVSPAVNELWTARKLFTTATASASQWFAMRGEAFDLTAIWRSNGPNLIRTSTDYFADKFPSRDATVAPDLPTPLVLPLVVADSAGLEITLPTSGSWSVEIQDRNGSTIKSFDVSQDDKVEWRFSGEGGGLSPGDYYVVLEPTEEITANLQEGGRFLLRIP